MAGSIGSNGPMRHHGDVVFTQLDEQDGVLLHLKTRKYYSLNQTGLVIWNMVGDRRTPAQISRSLADQFDVTAEEAEASVRALLADLAAEKLVEPADG